VLRQTTLKNQIEFTTSTDTHHCTTHISKQNKQQKQETEPPTMEGTETLIPYLKQPQKTEQPTIIIDTREATTAPKITKGLTEHGANIKLEALQKGDYIISDQVAIERKTVNDFVYTLTRRFLFDQLFKLKEAYQKPFILIEGYMPIVYKYSRIQPASVWGAMFTLAKQGINMIHTNSHKETIDFLYTAAKQEQTTEKHTPVIHPIKLNETLQDQQIFFLASLPNIGREKAISLLDSYQTPLNALLNVENWKKQAYGLGPIITEKVKQVLNTPHTHNTDQKTNNPP
jgi:Fanconi anemia group M protein